MASVLPELANDAAPVLTRTRLRPPRLPARFVPLARHCAGVDALLRHSVTKVRAPSGYGKSTLCTVWHAILSDRGVPTAWVSFEGDDDDPARAIGYILEAVGATLPSPSPLRAIAAGLLANNGVIVPQALATQLINAVDEAGETTVLLLDDVDRLSDPRILQFLNYLLLYCPPNLHLVLSCQARLALPLQHLDHHGLLLRVGVDDLRLTDAEATDVLAASNPALRADDVRRLNAAMAGWVTGLRIGSAALRNNRDALDEIGLVGHGARWLSDYLDENILHHLTPDARRFLMRCAIVETMNADLCAALSGLADAGVMLGWLADQNLFVQRLDDDGGGWFGIHAVFRELLLDRLASSDPGAKSALHRIASRWYAAHDRPAEAIGHALDGGDAGAAGALIDRAAMAMVEGGDILTLLGWLARLPVAAVEASVPLRLAEAWALTLSLRPQARAVLDTLARQPRSSRLDRELAGIETIFLAVYEDRLDAALAQARVFLASPSDDSFTTRAVRNAAAYCELARGNHAEVHALVRPVQLDAQRSEQIFPTAYRFCVVGLSYHAQGQFAEAERTFAAGLDLTRRRSGPGSASSALIVPFAARCRYERDDLDGAAALLAGWLPVIDEACFCESVLTAYQVSVRVAGARGDRVGAAALIEHAELLGHERGWQRLLARCMVERARLGLPQTMDADELVAVADEAALAAQPLSLKARTYAILGEYRAETALQAGDLARAAEVAERLSVLAQAAGNHELTLLANVYQLLPRLIRSEMLLPDTCTLYYAAAAAGYRRLLTDVLATPVRAPIKLPASWPRELTAHAARPPLGHVPKAAPRSVFELLTSREIDVLTGVSSGESNKDIARRLHLTPETVKWHLKNIMRKLGADSRSEAVAHAANLGLALVDPLGGTGLPNSGA